MRESALLPIAVALDPIDTSIARALSYSREMVLPGVSSRLTGRVFGDEGRRAVGMPGAGFGVAGKAVVSREAFAAAHVC